MSDNDWVVGGVGDFDNDGKADILWRNPVNGQNRIWLMNGLSRKQGSTINNLAGAEWVVGSLGDYNADGKADILWRNTDNGQNQVWLMDGVTRFDYSGIDSLLNQLHSKAIAQCIGANLFIDFRFDCCVLNSTLDRFLLNVKAADISRRTHIGNRFGGWKSKLPVPGSCDVWVLFVNAGW